MRKVTLLVMLALAAMAAGCSSAGASAPVAAPVVAEFSADAVTLTPGESVTLTWSVIGATAVAIDPTGSVPTEGSEEFFPKVTTTYTLMAMNSVGTASKSLMVKVALPLPPPPPMPVVNAFEVTPSSVVGSQDANLTWNVSGADSVTIEPGLGTVAATGSRSVTPGTTTTYRLKASNSAGSIDKSAVLKVDAGVPMPSIIYFEVFPDQIIGGPVMVKWKVAGATTVKVDPGIGTVSPFAQATVYPKATTTYTLTASNAAGTVTASGTVIFNNCGVPATCPAQPPPQ